MYSRISLCCFLLTVLNTITAQVQTPLLPPFYDANIRINSVNTIDYKVRTQTLVNLSGEPMKAIHAINYFDGLGRPMQQVIHKGSNISEDNNFFDLVTPTYYDNVGLSSSTFLPFVSTTGNPTDGSFKFDAFQQQANFYTNYLTDQHQTFFYGNTVAEPSPLFRTSAVYPAGNSWVGNNVGSETHYLNSGKFDDVKIWQVTGFKSYQKIGVYDDGTLSKMISSDEHNHKVVEYKDNMGRTILKKVQADDNVSQDGLYYTGWLCTAYIYDEYGLLRVVIPPKAFNIVLNNNWQLDLPVIDELCFCYEYDALNRMSIKKIPGADPIYMVYDEWDRLILTQDGNQRLQDNWVFTKYDFLNRPIYTGIYKIQQSLEDMIVAQQASHLGRFETFTPGVGIQYSLDQSFPVVTATTKMLTVTYYDNYDFTTALPTVFQQKDNGFDHLLYTPNYTQKPFPEKSEQSLKTQGMVTGTISYLLNPGNEPTDHFNSVIFYDDKGRTIQTISENIMDGINISTLQYNFIGQPLKSVYYQKTKVDGSDDNTHQVTVITTTEYDDLNRVTQISKKIDEIVFGRKFYGKDKIIVKNEYDLMGKLVHKKLGYQKLPGEERMVDYLHYDYNIRGWLTSINKNFLDGTDDNHYFGMELGYDNTNSVDISTTYSHPQLNGNIGGTIWRTKGDMVSRKYDFSYDNVNRLLAADFVQKENNRWDNRLVDFTVKMGDGVNYASAYDENGNILRMSQYGLKLGGSSMIDDLIYTYKPQSNKLLNVIDNQNLPSTTLGDFRTSLGSDFYNDKLSLMNNPSATQLQFESVIDYKYDANGSMTTDQNKDIEAISYNLLNLPGVITLKQQKGSITYVYDAVGNKIKKITLDNTTTNKTITTTTTYIDGFVYSKNKVTYTGTPPANPDHDKPIALETIPHEEGRIRYNPVTIEQMDRGMDPTFVYDYFVKDHLGNIRMVLTDEGREDKYPAATLEASNIADERNYYTIPTGSQVNKRDVHGYPEHDLTTSPNDYTQKLSGEGTQIGSSIILKVMSGDKFNVKVSSWYKNPGTSESAVISEPETSFFQNLVDALTGSVVSAAANAGHPISSGDLENSGLIPLNLQNFLTDPNKINPVSGRPKAYLNWILFDEQFHYVSSSSGAEQVPDVSAYLDENNEAIVYNHVKSDLPINRNGYLYIYVSNETPDFPVYFDNLQVTHYRGTIFEETHYYPFGLTMAGISSKAAGLTNNKENFNGKEFQNKEFSNGTGLETYDYDLRMQDPQIGRFWQIDPAVCNFPSWTPYNYAFNNPANIIDPDGATGTPTIDHKKKTVTITSRLWFYGGAANQARAEEIAASIQKQWNDVGGTYTFKDEDGNEQTYSVVFDVKGEYATDGMINSFREQGKFSEKDNFVRLENEADDKWAANSGILSWNNFKKDKTAAAHEYGHGLAWRDDNQANNPASIGGTHDMLGNYGNDGKRYPGIMTPALRMFLIDMQNASMLKIGPVGDVNTSYFDKNTNAMDPTKRKVTQRDIQIVLRNYKPGNTVNIGGKTNYLYNATGKGILKLR